MARRRDHGNFTKALDLWKPPQDAGEPKSCFATTFTFDAAFFETECLGRFLNMDSHPTESDPVSYLVEREEKLASTYSAVFVDRQHAGQKESLRWHVHGVAVPSATQHAKLSLLVWADAARLIVGSANLTVPGYRQNLEVIGSVDFTRREQSRVDLALEALDFLEKCLEFVPGQAAGEGPIPNTRAELDSVRQHLRRWPQAPISGDLALAVGGPGSSAFERLLERRPGGGQIRTLWAVAPFYERDGRSLEVAKALQQLVAQRGDREVSLDVPAETMPGGETVVRISKQLVDAMVASGADVNLHRVLPIQRGESASDPEVRPLHAKMFRLENDRAAVVMMGSSNCTAAGLGLGKARNIEANLIYTIKVGSDEFRGLDSTWPDADENEIDISDKSLRWEPQFEEAADTAGNVLPLGFEEALFKAAAPREAIFRFGEKLPRTWSVATEDGMPLLESRSVSGPGEVRVPWKFPTVPVVFNVTWAEDGRSCAASWSVNVLDLDALPPPDALHNLSLEELVEVLGSTRPLHEAIRKIFERRKKNAGGSDIELDPLRRVNTEEFLLRRTRRVALALDRLLERLERPALSEQAFCWRLDGPVGVVALADAFVKDARLSGESAFFLAELFLMLKRVRPDQVCRGGMAKKDVVNHLDRVLGIVRERTTSLLDERIPQAMAHYVREAIAGAAS